MTELLAPFGASPDVATPPAPTAATPRTPALITEQQVMFATAAAVPLRPLRTSRRWTDGLRAWLAAVFVQPSKESQPKPRHYPSRIDFLEGSRMAREMMRL
jgi:hypothetical protein